MSTEELKIGSLKRKWDWVGLVVRTKKEMRNGWGVIPAGTEMVVTHQRSGAHLASKPCACCGLTAIIAKVELSCLEPVRRAIAVPEHNRAIYTRDAVSAAWPDTEAA